VKFFPVVAVAEIKHILKRSGQSFKDNMGKIEQEGLYDFVEEHGHDHGA